jgi:small redox-active disulfide protein 2
MTIKILGSGCTRCNKLEQNVRNLAANNNLDANIEKVTDIQEMIKYGILATPGLVINEKLKSSGILPKDEQILAWIQEESTI